MLKKVAFLELKKLISVGISFTKRVLRLFNLKNKFLSWYNKDDRYSKQVLSGDLEGLRSFYMDRGYLDFKINSS